MASNVNVNVLVAVNSSLALEQGNLNGCVCMCDTNGYDQYNGGTSELITTITETYFITWIAVSMDPQVVVSITGFTGQAIPSYVNPVVNAEYPNNTVWGGQVLQSSTTNIQYSMNLNVGGRIMVFDPFLFIPAP